MIEFQPINLSKEILWDAFVFVFVHRKIDDFQKPDIFTFHFYTCSFCCLWNVFTIIKNIFYSNICLLILTKIVCFKSVNLKYFTFFKTIKQPTPPPPQIKQTHPQKNFKKKINKKNHQSVWGNCVPIRILKWWFRLDYLHMFTYIAITRITDRCCVK